MADNTQKVSGFAALREAEEEAKRNREMKDVEMGDDMMGSSANSDSEDETRDDDII